MGAKPVNMRDIKRFWDLEFSDLHGWETQRSVLTRGEVVGLLIELEVYRAKLRLPTIGPKDVLDPALAEFDIYDE